MLHGVQDGCAGAGRVAAAMHAAVVQQVCVRGSDPGTDAAAVGLVLSPAATGLGQVLLVHCQGQLLLMHCVCTPCCACKHDRTHALRVGQLLQLRRQQVWVVHCLQPWHLESCCSPAVAVHGSTAAWYIDSGHAFKSYIMLMETQQSPQHQLSCTPEVALEQELGSMKTVTWTTVYMHGQAG